MKIGPCERSIFWICVIVCMALSITALAMALPREVEQNNTLFLFKKKGKKGGSLNA